MKILIDENKYLTCFCVDAELDGGIEVETPADIDAFADTFAAYRYEKGRLVLDHNRLGALDDERINNNLRHKREKVCFPIINRGELWYSKLTEAQKDELGAWYQAWLDVTDTMVVPEAPAWLV
jgi:hypothetical protein